MRFHLTPRPLLHLLLAALLTPTGHLVSAKPAPAPSFQAGFSFNELFARWDCDGTFCGFSSQLCCTAASTCFTNSLDQAQCGAAGAATTAAETGFWELYTTTFVETDLTTITTVMSSFVGAPAATATAVCNYALNETPCGGICCASNQYCFTANQCAPAANGGSSGFYSTYTTPGATVAPGILPTSSSTLLSTVTIGPSTTVPFETPVATGANITLTSDESSGGGGLSGGAIAGIVIGVLLGLFLLGLLCFYCCLKGLLDGVLALFGLGNRRRRTTEVDEYERRSHHASASGGRTWYGASKPARVNRYEERKESHEGRNLLGLGAGLAALWAILGLKRRRDRRNEEKYSEYSYSSDYYTSASSASSDDRRTRDTRRSRR